ncbi:MAG: M48 family metallopeptidase [bacterium]
MWRQISSNRQKSFFLAAAMAFVLLFMGYAVGVVMGGSAMGFFGMFAALILWFMLTLISYFNGDKILLGVSGAKKITRDDLPELFNVVEEMKIASGFTRVPDIYVIDDASPNAFATGRSPESASVAVTSGLMQRLNRDELQGVIAHEMSHIVNRDVLFMMMIGIMMGAVVMMADMFFRISFRSGIGRRSSRDSGQLAIVMLVVSLVFMIVAPFAAQMIYFAVSRKREFLADACGAQLTRYPDGLASALEKISASPQTVATANRVTAPMYIVNPYSGMKKMAASLLATHPPIEERVRVLRGMAGQHSFEAYQQAWKASGKREILFSPNELKNNLFSQSGAAALATRGAPSPAPKPAAQPQSQAQRTAVNDFFWRQDGYGFIDCDCGVRLKIPSKFHSKTVYCTKCGKRFDLP